MAKLTQSTPALPEDNANQYYLPPVNVVRTWNTKRLLPNVLLSQYTPFAMLFLMDDGFDGFQTRSSEKENDSIVLGGPNDTISQLDKQFFSNPSNYSSLSEGNFGPAGYTNIVANSQYFTQSITDGTFQMGMIGGIPARLEGYAANENDTKGNDITSLIPLTLKLSQLVYPEGKGLLEINSIEFDIANTNANAGLVVGNVNLTCTDINQIYSYKSVLSQLFQMYQRYFIVIGWQGPTIDKVDLSNVSKEIGAQSVVISGTNQLSITLLDGNSYDLFLPSPFVLNNGYLNFPYDTTNNCYKIDVNFNDNGNWMMVPAYAFQPTFTQKSYREIDISFQFSSAGRGLSMPIHTSILVGGMNISGLRPQITEQINKLTPIATFDVASFHLQGKGFDAETNQDLLQAFTNNIAAAKNASDLFNTEPGGTSNSNDNTSSQRFSQLKSFPLAYRLGDVVTVCLQVFDTLMQDTTKQEDQVKTFLSHIAGLKIENGKLTEQTIKSINGKTDVKIEDLTYDDIFGQGKKEFQSIVNKMLGGSNWQSESNYSTMLVQIKTKFNYDTGNCVGWDVISPIDDGNTGLNYGKFLRILNQFRDVSGGNKLNDIKRFAPLFPSISAKSFRWSDGYINSIKSTGQARGDITMGDIPISVDTLARCLQQINEAQTLQDLVNKILIEVSVDYGFTLQLFYPVNSETTTKNKHLPAPDIYNPRSFDYTTGGVLTFPNIIIHDQFSTEKNLANAMMEQLNNLSQPIFKNTDTLANQWNIITPNMTSQENTVLQDSFDIQRKIIEAEYSSTRLNSVFIIDIMSNMNLTKDFSFGMLGNNMTIPQQYAIQKIYESMNNVNGMDTPLTNDVNDPVKTKIARNFAGVNQTLTLRLMNDYHLMPGKVDFEVKYLKLITDIYSDLIIGGKSQELSELFQTDPTLLNQLESSLYDNKLTDEERRGFIAGLVSDYLFQRPLGVKYSYYLGNFTANIHATFGLGIMQGIYVRGSMEVNDAVYGIMSVKHTFGNGDLSTQLTAYMVRSVAINKENSLITDLKNIKPFAPPPSNPNAPLLPLQNESVAPMENPSTTPDASSLIVPPPNIRNF